MTAPGYRLVPEAVMLWLNGEGPDHEGYWFGDAPNPARGAFWWRIRLREMLAAAPQPDPPADIVERAKAFILKRVGIGQARPILPHDLAAFAQEHAAAEMQMAAHNAASAAKFLSDWEAECDRSAAEKARAEAAEKALELISAGKEVRRNDGTTEVVDLDPGDAAEIAEKALAAIRARKGGVNE